MGTQRLIRYASHGFVYRMRALRKQITAISDSSQIMFHNLFYHSKNYYCRTLNRGLMCIHLSTTTNTIEKKLYTSCQSCLSPIYYT